MLRCCHRVLLCAATTAATGTSAAAAAAATSSSSTSSASPSAAGSKELLTGTSAFTSFESWISSAPINVHLEAQGVKLVPKTVDSRGMVALRNFREGTTVLSIPMSTLAINAEHLTRIQRARAAATCPPPSYDDVKRVMMSLSVRDPVLHQQMYLAILLAAERVAPGGSPFAAYFGVLPHPAVDDRAVMSLHKDVLDPLQLIEWDDHQRVFVTVCRRLHERWIASAAGAAKDVPPLEVVYWAFRTVLSRMHLLPDRGLVPANSKLNYSAYSTLQQVDQSESLTKRLLSTLRGLLPSNDPVPSTGPEFRLVPTLVPILDMAGHVPSTNVSVEVQPRPEVGSCVELQAVAAISEGEPIGMCVNRSQSIAFTLYRFGFLPV